MNLNKLKTVPKSNRKDVVAICRQLIKEYRCCIELCFYWPPDDSLTVCLSKNSKGIDAVYYSEFNK